MDLKTKRKIVKAFYNFLRLVLDLAGEEGIRLVKKSLEEWHASRTPKSKTTKKRPNRKKP